MLATFIERLSQMSESTSVFHGKMEENARLIEQAKSIAEIAPFSRMWWVQPRPWPRQPERVRELRGMREKAQATEEQIAKLHAELDRVSVQARHDPLTGVLNRKGSGRGDGPRGCLPCGASSALSVALLDIDNFKQLNDRLGPHRWRRSPAASGGVVAREVMRPQDTLARYGGEEFVVLMPDTPLNNGIEAMTRLQRELTKRFFLSGAEKVLITFSAGVAQLDTNETGADAIRRADQGMYLAKRAGKNQVLAA
ncbi:MAG: GGDEF domain-containing protein [Simplicispira sp.]|nr:GGDEF domain-containing protein [Simplicispira sp.]